tara:strand:+ start:93 stop:446 length:354 start_codon:yes stop_codon:yes gene_type:complete
MHDMQLLRNYIRALIIETHDDKSDDSEDDENLLLEPDFVEADDAGGPMKPDKEGADSTLAKKKCEISTVASIAGVTTPLGTGPTYPNGTKRRKKKSLDRTVGDAFGGARPVKKKSRK